MKKTLSCILSFLPGILIVLGMITLIIITGVQSSGIDTGVFVTVLQILALLVELAGWIMGFALMIIYVVMGFWIANHEFQFGIYVALSLGVGTISVFYRLAYSAWYPDLIPVGFEQKGYAISSTLYPLVTIVMSPVATFLYEKTSMSTLFFIVAGITFLSISIESLIKVTPRKKVQKALTFTQYKEDVKEGFFYLKREKASETSTPIWPSVAAPLRVRTSPSKPISRPIHCCR